MTQENENQQQEARVLKPKASLQTGVLETGGSGLHHSHDRFGSPPETVTPTDVSEADPFAEVPTASVASDDGEGMNVVGMQYEYPDGELLGEGEDQTI